MLKEHPNYWLAYNELGFGLHGQARYQEAVQAFRAASLAAPRNAMALSNLGGEYLQIGKFDEALESLKRGLALNPDSDLAAANTSLALRFLEKNEQALPFARKAVQLNPAQDSDWLELADCQFFLAHPSKRSERRLFAGREGGREHLLTDPADGPGWMLLALYKVKLGQSTDRASTRGESRSLGARDMDSQIYKARIFELLGKRDEALTTLAACASERSHRLSGGVFLTCNRSERTRAIANWCSQKHLPLLQCFPRWSESLAVHALMRWSLPEVEPGQTELFHGIAGRARMPMIIFLPKHLAEVNTNPITFPRAR